jgi:hypothetical protein
LLKPRLDIDMQNCPNHARGELNLSAAILERPVIEKIPTDPDPGPPPPPRAGARSGT